MRKRVFGRKFKRDANERKALLKGLMNDLVLKESIKTTEEKAKAIKGQIEKLVTKAKLKGEKSMPLLQPYLSPKAVEKVLKDLSVRFAKRAGGYTRVVKLGVRFGDNASMAIIEWVEKEAVVVKEAPKKNTAENTEKVSPKGTSFKEAAESTVAVEKETKKTVKKSEKKTSTKTEKKSTKTKK
ncbi:MAG TPA: 50S ribosomal protein L17 [Patescibacteria group bacterium]